MAKDPQIIALRRQLAAAISRAVGEGGQHVIAPSYGIPQPRMSELERGVVGRCTLEWLIDRIYRLGGTVRITVDVPDASRAWWVRQARRRAEERVARGDGTPRDAWVLRNLR